MKHRTVEEQRQMYEKWINPDRVDLAEYCFVIRFVPIKGAYINPNTVAVSEPIELDPKHLRRIDMGVERGR